MYLVFEFVVILCEKEATTKGNRVGNMYFFQWTSFLLYQIYCISKQKSCLYFYFSCTFPSTTKSLMRTVLSPFCFFSFIAIYIMFLNPHQCYIEVDHACIHSNIWAEHWNWPRFDRKCREDSQYQKWNHIYQYKSLSFTLVSLWRLEKFNWEARFISAFMNSRKELLKTNVSFFR